MAGRARDFLGRRREGYYEATHRPLNCLVFLLPLIVLYEVGSAVVGSVPLDVTPPERVSAFFWLLRFLQLFASMPTYVPGLLLIGLFLVWQLLSGARWRVRWLVVAKMYVESVGLCLPLLVFNSAFSIHLRAGPAGEASAWTGLTIALTAGLYEELIFRLLLIGLFRILLIDLLRLRQTPTMVAIVALTALLFAGYHYAGPETFDWRMFTFRAAAGVYLGGVYVLRGFGITVGVHALYDIAVTAL